MTERAITEISTISLYSNQLIVDGISLRADVLRESRNESTNVSAEQLTSILLLGRNAILEGIETFYEAQTIKNARLTIVRPSIWTAKLGTTAQTDGQNSKVFTERGYANGGINKSIDEIQPRFHEHWNAIKEAGFLPEVRRTSIGQSGGAWLLLRKPTLPEVLTHWFDEPADALPAAIDAISHDDKETERKRLRLYRMVREEAVDRTLDTVRPKEQVRLNLAMTAIKSALGDTAGYEDELEDALIYAHNNELISASTVRAIENSAF